MTCEYETGLLEKLTSLSSINITETAFQIPIDKLSLSTTKIEVKQCGNEIYFELSFISKTDIYVKAIEENKDCIDFIFDKCFEGYKFYLAKRQEISHNDKYSLKVELPCLKENNNYIVRVSKHNGFNQYCQGGGEIWELLIKIGNKFVSCKTNSELSNEYYDENEHIQIKPFISDKTYIAFWTKSKSHNKSIKIAVWGSCYTREVFHGITYLNADYKNWYEVVYTVFHHSIVSAVSKPLNINVRKRDNGNHYKLINKYGNNEFNKTVFHDLKNSKPDYLIIDLFTEANVSIYKVNDESYITDAFYLLETEEFKSLNKINKITIYDSQRYELFKLAVKEFRKRLLQIKYPLNRIILVSSRPAMQKNIDGKIIDWENQPWLKMSCEIWDRNDEYFLSIIPEARHIDMRDIKGISMDKSPLSMSTNHLQSQYYKEVLNRINKIVLSDLLNSKLCRKKRKIFRS